MKIRIEPEALTDIDGIYDFFLERESIGYALKITNEIFNIIDSLNDFAERGNYPKEMLRLKDYAYRELHCAVFRIIYTIKNDYVIVMMVVDSRRDLVPLAIERGLMPAD